MLKCFKIIIIIFLIFNTLPGRAQSTNENHWVGIIYDDSGSMIKANRHDITAYAFKLFTTLLMPEDTVALLTMSNISQNSNAPPRIFPGTRKKQLINYIDGLRYYSSTPVETVRQMLIFLRKIKSNHKSLMILTDGIFEPEPHISLPQYISPEENLIAGYLILNPDPSLLQGIKQQNVLPILLQIANGSENLGQFFVNSHQEIPTRLGELFAFVTGKNVKGQENFIQINNNQLLIKSPFPIRSIRLIYQNTTGNAITITQINRAVKKEIFHHSLPSKNLYAISGILLFTPNIEPDSTIVVELNQSIDPNALFIFLDTSLDLQLSVQNTNMGEVKPINQSYLVGAGDSLWLEGKFTFQNKGFQFAPSLIQRLKFYAQIRGGKRLEFSTQDRLLFKTPKFVLPPHSSNTIIIDVFASFPGHFQIHRKLAFNTAPIHTKLLINGQSNYDSLYTSIPRHQLSSIHPAVFDIITEDGDTVTTYYKINIIATPPIKHRLKQQGQRQQLSFDNYFFPWKDPQDSVTLKITAIPKTNLYTPQQTSLTIYITPSSFWDRWLSFILTVFSLLLFLKFSLCALFVKHFPRRARIYIYTIYKRIENPPKSRKLHRLVSYFFCRRERRTIASIKFLAGTRRSIFIDKKFAKGKTTILVNGLPLDEASYQGKKHIPVTETTEIEIQIDRNTQKKIRFSPHGK